MTPSPSGMIRCMRKVLLVNDEYYHVFGRGVDKRQIFMDARDYARFLQSMEEFNTVEPIGSIFENSFRKRESQLGDGVSKLVEFICYCLNPNHYHFLMRQVADKGIEKFMHRLCLGYARYFNIKCQRSGSLFQGPFKAVCFNHTHLSVFHLIIIVAFHSVFSHLKRNVLNCCILHSIS